MRRSSVWATQATRGPLRSERSNVSAVWSTDGPRLHCCQPITPAEHDQDNGRVGATGWLTRNGLPARRQCWSLPARVRQFVARSRSRHAATRELCLPRLPSCLWWSGSGAFGVRDECRGGIFAPGVLPTLGARVRPGWRRQSRCRCSRCRRRPRFRRRSRGRVGPGRLSRTPGPPGTRSSGSSPQTPP